MGSMKEILRNLSIVIKFVSKSFELNIWPVLIISIRSYNKNGEFFVSTE